MDTWKTYNAGADNATTNSKAYQFWILARDVTKATEDFYTTFAASTTGGSEGQSTYMEPATWADAASDTTQMCAEDASAWTGVTSG